MDSARMLFIESTLTSVIASAAEELALSEFILSEIEVAEGVVEWEKSGHRIE